MTDRIQFDVHGQYSLSKGEYTFEQILQDSITQQTQRAYGYGCAGLFTAIENKPCLQMNWVDPRVMAGFLPDEEVEYLIATETGSTDYEQMFVEASVAGELIDLPAGPLGFAFGGVIRRDEIDDRPGQLAEISRLIGEAGANVIEVIHQRMMQAVSLKRAELEIVIEARDQYHVDEIVSHLRAGGFRLKVGGVA